ncbi:kyphoscoliosis peptidase-like isoform X1 [Centruroides sculpturatus]|uniref:kyphoscoliosis peptidase-like isoform X1 n=2 Tax=Centruroides sculpturatus TaxID=218467 RepID=UPI000C6DBD2E|nr:kyphoscoliosis peptidase-like isoform X1 [Centruroides sculpturatus]
MNLYYKQLYISGVHYAPGLIVISTFRMGCGTSRSSRLISPFSKAVITPNLTWTNTGVIPLTRKKVAEKSVQVGDILGRKEVSAQTDNFRFPMDELEMLLEEDSDQPENTDVETQTWNQQSSTRDNVKSVLMQTEISPSQKKFAYFNMLKNNSVQLVTIDIGIQAVPLTLDRCTQTYRLIKKPKTSSGKERSVDPLVKKIAEANRHKGLAMADFESQTDPVTKALAANAAGNENLLVMEADPPIAHIQKELFSTTSKPNQTAIHESIARLLEDVEDSLRYDSDYDGRFAYADILKCDAGVQTVNDPITDEAPEYAARPPPCRKKEMIPNMGAFKEIDRHALEAPESTKSSVRNLVNYLSASAKNDLQKVRVFFRWITNNISYDWRYMEVRLSAEEVLQRGEGVCKDYCKLFSEMCRIAGIRVKTLNGFAKGYDYRPGEQFLPGEAVTHAWNAIYIFGSWRLIDTTWGTGYTDHTGRFQRKLNEHFFLTDPEVLIWTHFPYDEVEKNYSRWQLLDNPLSLDEFNTLPKVTPFFFDYNIKIRSKPTNPVVFKVHKEIKLASHEPLRYKYKMYPVDEIENASLNNYVFCQLKEDRLVGSFAITPPVEGRYYFKIYAKPEKEMKEDTSLHNIIIFLIECLQAKKYLQPYPLNEVPWGPTQSFYDYNMRLVNQSGPMIVSWGGKKKLVIQISDNMLFTHQLFDVDGKEMDSKGIISREEKDNKITINVTPTRVAMYKLMLFGMPKPKQKGKWRLPLVASFLIDCKLTKQIYDEDYQPPQQRKEEKEEEKKDEKKKKEKRKIKIAFIR